MTEQARVEAAAVWYTTQQLEIDRLVLRHRYRVMAPFLKGPTGLELGPAEGAMTELLLPHFERLTAVDGAASLIDVIPDHPRLTKVAALFEEYTPSDRFDTVVLDHVLEHVDVPADLVARAREWLAPDGVVVVGVPNASSLHRLAAVKMGLLETPASLNERDRSLGHRRVYDLERLADEVESVGLTVIHKGGVFMKPLSNGQIEATWTPEMVEAFALLGEDLPHLAAEIFVVCRA